MPQTTSDFYPWISFLEDELGASRQFGEDHTGEVVGEDPHGPVVFPKKYKRGSRVMAYRPETMRYIAWLLSSQGRSEPIKRGRGRPRKNPSPIAAE